MQVTTFPAAVQLKSPGPAAESFAPTNVVPAGRVLLTLTLKASSLPRFLTSSLYWTRASGLTSMSLAPLVIVKSQKLPAPPRLTVVSLVAVLLVSSPSGMTLAGSTTTWLVSVGSLPGLEGWLGANSSTSMTAVAPLGIVPLVQSTTPAAWVQTKPVTPAVVPPKDESSRALRNVVPTGR